MEVEGPYRKVRVRSAFGTTDRELRSSTSVPDSGRASGTIRQRRRMKENRQAAGPGTCVRHGSRKSESVLRLFGRRRWKNGLGDDNNEAGEVSGGKGRIGEATDL